MQPLAFEEIEELKRQIQAAGVHRRDKECDGGRTITLLRRADVPMIGGWSREVEARFNQQPVTIGVIDALPLGEFTHVKDQEWHRDAERSQVSIGVALSDVKDENGPMEFENGFRAVGPAGSRWIFDQRARHRGTVNRADEGVRSVAVVRYMLKV